ncbi:hypothetical protein EYF80_060005 [Liparis tanakae]|uniref:Uncharacterized protein n=1 Tax=Liparis tanakae TaxID=230148 RepID=A0A4Z2EM51_9TELE|nr:hypothetical protein EYF80_060005 [Liparis tanakae]
MTRTWTRTRVLGPEPGSHQERRTDLLSTLQPTSLNTAVKKGLPARTLPAVLHSSRASTTREPTHTPAGSKLGVSSASHSRASRVRA